MFSKLFNRKKEDKEPVMPTRPLKLQYLVTPENGEKFAQQFVDAVKNNENLQLDYSVATLGFVDQFLQAFRDEGLTVNDFAETIFTAGCYVGQVCVYNNGGEWIDSEEAELPDGVSMMNLVIKLPNGTVIDPITKSYKRFSNGPTESITYFYQVFTNIRQSQP